jgi:CopG family nickel-responsive transcriptional regulator
MKRFTISLDEKLASEFERLIRERGNQNRSEAVRDMEAGHGHAYSHPKN